MYVPGDFRVKWTRCIYRSSDSVKLWSAFVWNIAHFRPLETRYNLFTRFIFFKDFCVHYKYTKLQGKHISVYAWTEFWLPLIGCESIHELTWIQDFEQINKWIRFGHELHFTICIYIFFSHNIFYNDHIHSECVFFYRSPFPLCLIIFKRQFAYWFLTYYI